MHGAATAICARQACAVCMPSKLAAPTGADMTQPRETEQCRALEGVPRPGVLGRSRAGRGTRRGALSFRVPPRPGSDPGGSSRSDSAGTRCPAAAARAGDRDSRARGSQGEGDVQVSPASAPAPARSMFSNEASLTVPPSPTSPCRPGCFARCPSPQPAAQPGWFRGACRRASGDASPRRCPGSPSRRRKRRSHSG